jgi:putative ABC transport system permease protein
LIPGWLKRFPFIQENMILHFLKNTLRVFSRNGIYTIINLLGLSIGLTAGILILMFVVHELSYDRFHENGRNTAVVKMVYHTKDYVDGNFTIPAAIGPSLFESFPEVESFTRIRQPGDGFFVYNGNISQAERITWVDSTFFSNFSFRLLRGNPKTALASLYSVVLTEKMAGIIFGDEDPMGKVLRLNNEVPYTVTGIVENPPSNTIIKFNALLSFMTLYEDKNLYMDWDGGNQYLNFVVFSPAVDRHEFHKKLQPFLFERINERYEAFGVRLDLAFEPLRGFYLNNGRLESGISALVAVYIFSTIALLVLLIACFNFTNLSTARAMGRAKETGIRKVAGATRNQLIRQFLAEALLMSLLAFGLALIIIELVNPWYNALIGIELSFYGNQFAWVLPLLFVLVFLTGIFAGAYPAFFLSSFQPVKVLKGGMNSGRGKATFSKALVVFQFMISVALINITWTIYRQLSYMRHHDVGMHTEEVIGIYLPGQVARDAREVLQIEIRSIAGVISCGAASEIPGSGLTSNGYRPEGYEEPVMINVIDVDADFLETMGIEVIQGRNFIRGAASDQTSYLVNETFIKQFNYPNPIGVMVRRDGNRPIIGVVKDFNFSTLHEPVKPLILTNEPWLGFTYLLVRINPANREHVANQLELLWREMLPGEPYISHSVDEYIESAYATEKRFGEIFTWFTLLGLFVACLGLFGLSSYAVQQRKKEIGMRKLLGASTGMVVKMITRSFTWLVLLANFLALIPVILVLRIFLDFYSYAITPGYWMFIITAIGSLVLAWITVAWQSFRAAGTNPAEVIKYD